jgi:hypothetical protein
MLPVVVLLAIILFFLLVGCGSGGSPAGSQAEHNHAHQAGHSHQNSGSEKLDLHPESDSGVSGSVSFEDVSEGVLVKLELRELPKPNTLYLAHIHPGTCAEEEPHEHGSSHGASHGEEGAGGHEHGGAGGHEHGGGAEIEYPLSQVKSDSEGRGSSTTTLRDTSVEQLFSGQPKHVNVHAAGSGNPPVLTCADLQEAG